MDNPYGELYRYGRVLASQNATDSSISIGEVDSILDILYAGTGLSFCCSSFLLWTFVFTKALHERRALWHMVVKSVAVMTMVLGYWMNLYVYGKDCYDVAFCSSQFALLQLGNVGILVSELALTNEVVSLILKFKSRNLNPSLKTPFIVRAAYLGAIPFALLSIVVGLAFHLSGSEKYGLECSFDAWCWYASTAMQFAFKFAIIEAIILEGIIAAGVLVYHMKVHKEYHLNSAGRQMTRTILLFILVHLISWGATAAWRTARAQDPPPHWTSSPKSLVVKFVIFNAAGAGYADLLVWLSFPIVRRKYVDPPLLWLSRATGVGEKELEDMRATDANFEEEDEIDDEKRLGSKIDSDPGIDRGRGDSGL